MSFGSHSGSLQVVKAKGEATEVQLTSSRLTVSGAAGRVTASALRNRVFDEACPHSVIVGSLLAEQRRRQHTTLPRAGPAALTSSSASLLKREISDEHADERARLCAERLRTFPGLHGIEDFRRNALNRGGD